MFKPRHNLPTRSIDRLASKMARPVWVVVIALALVKRSVATRRALHPIHKQPGVEESSRDEAEVGPPWTWDDQSTTTTTATFVESAEEVLATGLQSCPNEPDLTGYSSWEALAAAVENNKSNMARDPYLLCPQFVYNAKGATLTITHYNTVIQCADLSGVCVVQEASIMINENLPGIRFEGIDFVNPAGAIVIGKGSHMYFINSSIQGAVFNEIEELQAPLVSYGHLFVIGSRFINNLAHGAIWAVDDTLYVDRSQFQHNTAISFLNSAAAIHIGSGDPKAIVASSITDSCFEGNAGYHIVLVEGAQASVSWSAGNAADSEAECPGITTAFTATTGYCQPFDMLGTSCDALLAPTAAPTNKANPLASTESEPVDALAEAATKVTFTSASQRYGLSVTVAVSMIGAILFVTA